MIEIATKDPKTMTDDEIVEEYDSYPSELPDLETHSLVRARRRALADAYNAREGKIEYRGPMSGTRRVLT